MTVLSPYLPIIALNGLNSPFKRHGVAEWIKKQDPSLCCPKETRFSFKGTQTEMETGFPFKWKPKESGGSYIRQSRLKPKTVTRDKSVT